MSGGYTPAWSRGGWLGEPLEEVEWEPLARHREAHEAAVEALDAAKKKADRDAAMHQLLDVVEAAQRELADRFDEAEEAFAAMRKEIGPVPERADKRAAIAPRLAAGRRDRDRLVRVRNLVTAEALTDAGLEPAILAEVAEWRAELPAARPKAPEPEGEATPDPEQEAAEEEPAPA